MTERLCTKHNFNPIKDEFVQYRFLRYVKIVHLHHAGQSKKPVIVCMIHVTPSKWSSRGRAVRHTWAYRCPHPIFFYTDTKTLDSKHEIRTSPDAVGLNVPDGRQHLTVKTLAGLEYAYKKYGSTVDWFMKADDDTLVTRTLYRTDTVPDMV